MFIELFAQVKAYFYNAHADGIFENVAYQFNIVGENGGTFYLQVKDRKIFVEPYDYHDCDANITTSEESVIRIIKGDLEPIFAHNVGLVNIVGNMDKIWVLKDILQQTSVKEKDKKFRWIDGDKYIEVAVREDGQDSEGKFLFVFRLEHSDHQSYGQIFSAECQEEISIVEVPGDVYAQKVGNKITFLRGNQLNDNGLTEIWVKIAAERKPKIELQKQGRLDLVS